MDIDSCWGNFISCIKIFAKIVRKFEIQERYPFDNISLLNVNIFCNRVHSKKGKSS